MNTLRLGLYWTFSPSFQLSFLIRVLLAQPKQLESQVHLTINCLDWLGCLDYTDSSGLSDWSRYSNSWRIISHCSKCLTRLIWTQQYLEWFSPLVSLCLVSIWLPVSGIWQLNSKILILTHGYQEWESKTLSRTYYIWSPCIGLCKRWPQ